MGARRSPQERANNFFLQDGWPEAEKTAAPADSATSEQHQLTQHFSCWRLTLEEMFFRGKRPLHKDAQNNPDWEPPSWPAVRKRQLQRLLCTYEKLRVQAKRKHILGIDATTKGNSSVLVFYLTAGDLRQEESCVGPALDWVTSSLSQLNSHCLLRVNYRVRGDED